MWNSSSSLSGEQAESCHQEPWAGVQPTITLNPCYPSGLRSGSGSTEVDGRVLLGSSAQPAPACTVGDLRPVLSPTFLSRGMRRRLVLLPTEPFPRTPTPSNTPRDNWNDWGWGDRPAGFTLTFQSHLCASQPSTKSQKNSFMELNREEAAFGLERVPAGVLQWPAPPKLQNRKEIPGSSSETWRRACPTCLAGSQAGGTEDSHPWLSHIVRGRSPGCTSLPSLLLDGSPHLERSPDEARVSKEPSRPTPWTLQDHPDDASDAPWLPGALGTHGPGHLGKEEGSRALATSGGGRGGWASTLLAWGQGCGIYNHPGACKCLEQLFYFEAMSN